MTTDILFNQFDQLITRAGDIPRLNELILQLAVRGQLVPQNPADEPAVELLKRIKAEKARRIKAGEIRKPKPHPALKSDELPDIDLPSGWVWARFGDVTYAYRGHNPPKHQFVDSPREGYVRFVQITDFKTEERAVYVPISPKNKIVKKGEIVMAAYRHIGKLSREMEGAFNVALCKVVEILPMSRDYIELLISSDLVKGELLKASGRSHIPSMHTKHLLSLPIPLPPLAEQRRIVERVEQLLAQTRALEAELAAAEAERAALTRASLHHLTAAPTPAALREQWQQLAPAFDALLTDPAAVDDLKQAILQLAVQGRLVPQNPTDEPASALLKRIKAEKARLVKEGQITKEKPLPPISADEIPFETPEGWVWTQLIEICSHVTDIEHKMPKSVESGVKFISAKDLLDDGTINFEHNIKYISEEDFDRLSKRVIPQKEDIIYSRIGAKLGKARIVETDERFLVSYSCCVIRPIQLNVRFLNLYLDSGVVLEQAMEHTKSIGVPDLGIKKIKGFATPLPPLAEQRRIVERVAQLLALCDDLKAQLAAGESARARLLASLLHGVGNGKDEG